MPVALHSVKSPGGKMGGKKHKTESKGGVGVNYGHRREAFMAMWTVIQIQVKSCGTLGGSHCSVYR